MVRTEALKLEDGLEAVDTFVHDGISLLPAKTLQASKKNKLGVEGVISLKKN